MVLTKLFREALLKDNEEKERKTMMERPPPYAPCIPLRKRAEIDPPPWPRSEILYTELFKEEGMYPIVRGTFYKVTDDEPEESESELNGNRWQIKDELGDEEEFPENRSYENVTPNPTPTKRNLNKKNGQNS